MSTPEEKAVADRGRITDGAIERLRQRIGIPQPHPVAPHYSRPGIDAFRHVAEAYGDDNPLWSDEAYASESVWGGVIAPPPLVGGDSLIGHDELSEWPEDLHQLMRGDPLSGVHAFYSASAREWWAPLRPDRSVLRRNALVGVLDKSSGFAGRAVHEWTGQVFQDGEGPLLSAQYRLMIRTEREKARQRQKNDEVEPRPYADEEIGAIEAQYATERPRGRSRLLWEDVGVGTVIGPMVKGPLTVTDIICWHVGMGMGLYGVRPLRLGSANRARIPGFFHRDELNVPDVMQRVHWDPAFARRSGNPTIFDYGRMRETWLIHLCTDWMGDDAWLWKLDCEFRKFNFVGDTQWLGGSVSAKYVTDGRPVVELELRAVNQRGEVTTPGHATVILPSSQYGPVVLPDPPGKAKGLAGALEAIADDFASGIATPLR
jgi:acyl dehydratase